MKKFLKVILIAGLLIVVVIGAASVLLHVILPPEKAKALVLKQLAAHLHREVSMGTVSVGLFTGVSVADLRVSEAPNFSKGTFLASDQFALNVALTPLLFRKVVAQVVLRHPEVTVIRQSDGVTFNFSDLTAGATGQAAPSPAAPPASTQEKPPFQLLVSRAEVAGGVIHFIDHSPEQQSIEINPLNLKLKNASLTATFGLQVSLKARAHGHEVAFDLNGQANVLSGDFTAKTCVLSSGGSLIRLSGRASQLKTAHPAGDFKVDMEPFDPGTWKPWLTLPPDLRWVGPMVAHAHVKGNEKTATLSVRADLTKVQLSYAKSFAKPAKVPLTLALDGTLENLRNLQLEAFQLALGGLKVSAHGSVDGVRSSEPSVTLHAETNSMPMAELATYASASLPPDVALSGSSHLTADISGTTASARVALKWDGRELGIVKGNLFTKPVGMPLELSLIGEALRPHVKGTPIQNFNFQTFNGTLSAIEWTGNGAYKTVGTKSDLVLALKTNSWSLAEAAHLSPLLATYRPSGRVAMDVRISGPAAAPQANGALVLNEVGAHYEQSAVAGLAGTLTFTQQDLNAPKLAGKLNGSDFSLQLTGHHLQTQPDLRVDASFAELDLNRLLPATPAAAPKAAGRLAVTVAEAAMAPAASALTPMKLSGHVTVGKIKHAYYQGQALDMKWNLSDVTPELSRINGTATLRQGPGHLLNVEKLAAQSRAARLALLPLLTIQRMDTTGVLKSLGIPSLQDIPFDNIKGDYVFQNGVMTVKDFDLNGNDLTLLTQGTIGLAGVQPLNLTIQMKLAAGAVGGTLGQIFQDEKGRATLHLIATGTANDPKVRMDLQQAGHAVQDLGRELLKGLSGSAPPPAGDGSSPPANTQKNPVDDLQKTLKNIFH